MILLHERHAHNLNSCSLVQIRRYVHGVHAVGSLICDFLLERIGDENPCSVIVITSVEPRERHTHNDDPY